MRIAFRVDSSKDIGTGHVMRCLALAERLVEHGIDVLFCCRELPGNIIERIKAKNYSVKTLAAPNQYRAVQDSSDYAGWLQVSERDDALEFIGKIESDEINIVIVDHYALSSSWERFVKENIETVIVIDDLVRVHRADLVIDQTYSRTEDEYSNEHVKNVLAGSTYALLREEFYEARERLVRKQVQRHRLLITMGGIDLNDSTSRIVTALAKQSLDWLEEVQIILSENAPNFKRVKSLVSELDDKFILHSHIDNMASFMSEATISIGAPGSTSWERACLGLPSVLIPLADNQIDIARVFSENGAAELVSLDNIDEELINRLLTIRKHWKSYSQRNMRICDGLGIGRVIQHMFPPTAKDNQRVYLKKATIEHIEMVYKWQCQPDTRRFARNTQIPAWPEHRQWMTEKLSSSDCYFYIIYHGADPAGVVRLERLGGVSCSYEVSIFLSSDKKRLGLASTALTLAAKLHKKVEIFATVFDENEASKKLFLSSGYQNVSENLYKLIR